MSSVCPSVRPSVCDVGLYFMAVQPKPSRLIQTSGPQTENPRLPNWALVQQSKRTLAVDERKAQLQFESWGIETSDGSVSAF